MVGRAGFEPTKPSATALQAALVNRLSIYPYCDHIADAGKTLFTRPRKLLHQ